MASLTDLDAPLVHFLGREYRFISSFSAVNNACWHITFQFFFPRGGAEGKTRHVFSFCFGGESWDSFVQAGLPTVPMQFPKTAVTPKVMAAGASLSPRTLGVSRVHIPKLDHSEHV